MAATDEFGKHEVLHTASIILEMFETYLLEHEAVETDADVKAAADKVFDELFRFYQLVGAKWLEKEKEDE